MTNIPATPWQDPSREVEYTIGDASNIVDPLGDNLVDPNGNQVIDTGVTADYMAATDWEEDEAS